MSTGDGDDKQSTACVDVGAKTSRSREEGKSKRGKWPWPGTARAGKEGTIDGPIRRSYAAKDRHVSERKMGTTIVLIEIRDQITAKPMQRGRKGQRAVVRASGCWGWQSSNSALFAMFAMFDIGESASAIRSTPLITNESRWTKPGNPGCSEGRSCVYLAVPQTIASSVDEVGVVCEARGTVGTKRRERVTARSRFAC